MLKKSLLALSLTTATLTSVHAAEFLENDCNQNPQSCEVITLVDFDGDIATEQNSLQFLDWDTIFQDAYTGSEGSGSTTLLGSNPKYNYQGIQGLTSNQFADGEYVVVTLQNLTDTVQTFRPKISFADTDRVYGGEEELWIDLYSVTLLPNSSGEVSFHFDSSYGQPFSANSINFNTNVSGNRTVAVDKIEYKKRLTVDDPVTVDCSTSSECVTLTVADFSANSLQGVKDSNQLSGFDTPLFYDLGVAFHSSGVGLTTQQGVTNGDYLYYGVHNELGEHTFKAGEQIVIEVANFEYGNDVLVQPFVSFDDTDTKAWAGSAGTWYPMTETLLQGGHLNTTITFTFDETNAGTYDVINVTLPTDQTGELVIRSISYRTSQKMKATF
jgi:hypothetical protein